MPEISIPWHPRMLMVDRVFRLPVSASEHPVTILAGPVKICSSRWDSRDGAWYYYLKTPSEAGDYVIEVRQGTGTARVEIQVRTLDQMREPREFNGLVWPRRWTVGQPWESTKQKQTLQDTGTRRARDDEQLAWWSAQTDASLWRQLPWPEFPQAHFVNVNQGCPSCGSGVFRFNGFYPWIRDHMTADYRSTCPSCQEIFPSNDFAAGDYTSGDRPDDGFGYFDAAGHVFLFTATYHRDQVSRVDGGLQQITNSLRTAPFDEKMARRLAILLLRYASDALYLATVPQFRYGPSMGIETPWIWGQPDWATHQDPLGALFAKGMRRYAIDIPYVSESLALAYDTIWPFIREDEQTVDRAQALGLSVRTPADVIMLIEEMLAAKLQCIMDRGARSNLPRESMGALMLVRALDRPDAQGVMDWLYDDGPDRLRVFGINDFFPDGTPPESTGGYNSIHTNGLFSLEYHLRALRLRHPGSYPEARYPSLVGDPRAARVARAAHEVTMIGRSWFQFGDGSAPGCKDAIGTPDRASTLALKNMMIVPDRIEKDTLSRAAEYTEDPVVQTLQEISDQGGQRAIGTTVHDGVGIAILRTEGTPESAALGISYGDTSGHRHMDLLDVQLFAFDRPFLTDLGYPQSWASVARWEAHWATHNTVWGTVPNIEADRLSGRGRLIRCLSFQGIQILEIEAERWHAESDESHTDLDSKLDVMSHSRWRRPGVNFRRLLALIETEEKGVIVVDLSRIQGGNEHWRACRGLNGSFTSDDIRWTDRSGNAANKEAQRGDEDSLPHPDQVALAWMDKVRTSDPISQWKGSWQSSREAEVHLDVFQTRISDSTELMCARATATMGTPEESSYCYPTLLWRRTPDHELQTTAIDLVMEPRIGARVLHAVSGLGASEDSASAVALRTVGGRSLTIYWSPDSDEKETTFEDGVTLSGQLAVVTGSDITVCGDGDLNLDGRVYRGPGKQTARVESLNRDARTVDVSGLTGLEAGDRIRVNPDGRGHSYAVETLEPLGPGRLRLTLDVTSLLGRSSVKSCTDDYLDLNMAIMARTGNLNQTRLLVGESEKGIPIVDAVNHDRESTRLWVAYPESISTVQSGDWVNVVDYVVGDLVEFEPIVTIDRSV